MVTSKVVDVMPQFRIDTEIFRLQPLVEEKHHRLLFGIVQAQGTLEEYFRLWFEPCL